VSSPEISIDLESYASPAARTLVAALTVELAGRYPGDDPDCKGGEPEPEEFDPPHGRFLLARLDEGSGSSPEPGTGTCPERTLCAHSRGWRCGEIITLP
jgi:hypothetical protein